MSSATKLQKVAQKVRTVLEKIQPFAAGLATLDRRAAAINAVILALQATLKKSAKNDDDLSIELLTEFSNAIAKVKPHMTRKGKNSLLRILDRCKQLLSEETSNEQVDTSTHLKNRSR